MDLQALFLIFLSLAILCVVGAMGAARGTWRRDVPRFSRRTRVWDLVLHPGRYVEPRATSLIRASARLGLLFLVAAAGTIVVHLAADRQP